jgi:hypothetical protein
MMTMRLLTFVFAMCLAGAAEAQPSIQWTVPGSACIPDAATVAANNYKTNIASVQFAPAATGQVVLTCQIERFDVGNTSWQLILTYQDPTGTATTASVRAWLYRMAIGLATPTPTPILVTSLNSNGSAATGLSNRFSTPFTHTFDFNANIYWARVILDRTATTQNVVFHSLMLSQNTVPSDVRLKHDIALLGHLDNGLGFYRFSYNGDDKAYVGVMAQEVEAVMPDNVVRGEDGYLRVFYDRLGLRLQSWEEWVAAGEKIPH